MPLSKLCSGFFSVQLAVETGLERRLCPWCQGGGPTTLQKGNIAKHKKHGEMGLHKFEFGYDEYVAAIDGRSTANTHPEVPVLPEPSALFDAMGRPVTSFVLSTSLTSPDKSTSRYQCRRRHFTESMLGTVASRLYCYKRGPAGLPDTLPYAKMPPSEVFDSDYGSDTSAEERGEEEPAYPDSSRYKITGPVRGKVKTVQASKKCQLEAEL
jgi:hypothetical protein